MKEHGVEQDPRVREPCFAYPLYYLILPEFCTTVDTQLLYIARRVKRELVAEESAYIFDFDGSIIKAPTNSG